MAVFLTVTAVTLSAFACVPYEGGGSQSCGPSNRDEIFAFASLADWVSYADQVSVVHSLSERAGGSKVIHDFEAVGRVVTLKIEDNLWAHPKARRFASVESLIDVQSGGWTIEDRRTVKTRPECREEIDVGKRFLVALFYVRQPQGENAVWAPLTYSSVIPLDGDVCAPEVGTAPAAQALAGKTTAHVRKRLQNTKPYPLAAKYADQPPFKRLLSVSRELRRSSQPKPVETDS